MSRPIPVPRRPAPDAPALEVIRGAGAAAALLKGTRRQLLAHLAEPDSAAGVARKLDLPRQRVNYHLRTLERAGLVECVEQRRKGNCVERLVRATARSFVISPEALGAIGTTADTAPDRFSAAFLMSIASRTLREVAALDARARQERKRLATLVLDAEIRFASAEARAAFADELSDAVARLTAKYHDGHARQGRPHRLVAAVHPVPSGPPPARPHGRPRASAEGDRHD